MAVFWHRRDFRIRDNWGLAAATGHLPQAENVDGSESIPIVPLYVIDPAILDHASSVRVDYLLACLEALRKEYRQCGGELLIRRGDPQEIVPEVTNQLGTDTVHWNRGYSWVARTRDVSVANELQRTNISAVAHPDILLQEPGTIVTESGKHYSKFSYFWRKWREREQPEPVPAPAPTALRDGEQLRREFEPGSVPSLTSLGFSSPTASIPSAGPAVARNRLATFIEEDIYEYGDHRDFPAAEVTSRLSHHLRWGTIGIRTVDQAVQRARNEAPDEDAGTSVEEFYRQLAWREFYYHVLSARPDVVIRNYREPENEIEWRNDPTELTAWQRGQTGYPIVDAGMRQLRSEAWIHNRVRMIVSSFLTKDLLVDWRIGYDWFRRHLLDHDPASESGGWQWIAGTGTDAQPYFRVFNPMTQGERYDPTAEYVTAHVPELRGVDPDVVWSWDELTPDQRKSHAPNYPDPIVNHSQRREQAIETFRTAWGQE